MLQVVSGRRFDGCLLIGRGGSSVVNIISMGSVVLVVKDRRRFSLYGVTHPTLFVPRDLCTGGILRLFGGGGGGFTIIIGRCNDARNVVALRSLARDVFKSVLRRSSARRRRVIQERSNSVLMRTSVGVNSFVRRVNVLSCSSVSSRSFAALNKLTVFLVKHVPGTKSAFTCGGLLFRMMSVSHKQISGLLIVQGRRRWLDGSLFVLAWDAWR